MKYFQIEYSTDLKIIGSYPQVQNSVIVPLGEVEKMGKIHFRQVNPFSSLPANIYFPAFQLSRRAKPTDLLSVVSLASMGIVISNKFKSILEPHIDDDSSFFPIDVVNAKGQQLQYWLLHIPKSSTHFIDFPNTEVWRLKGIWEKDERLEVNSDEEFKLFKKRFIPPEACIQIEKACFIPNIESHVFSIDELANGKAYILSEILMLEAINSEISGVSFKLIS